jgi:hypothetical protein
MMLAWVLSGPLSSRNVTAARSILFVVVLRSCSSIVASSQISGDGPQPWAVPAAAGRFYFRSSISGTLSPFAIFASVVIVGSWRPVSNRAR